jgi:hypothetical protein
VVLVLAVLFLVGGAAGGLVLLQHERAASEDPPAARTTWDDYEVLKRALVVHATVSPCQEVTAVDLVETDTRVEVTVGLSGDDNACADPPVELTRRVRLASPLGDRGAYDGGCLADGGTDECVRYERADPLEG